MSVTLIYVDVNTGDCYSESGGQFVNSNRLVSYLDSHETYELHYVTNGGAAGTPDTWDKYTGFAGSAVASLFGIDNNVIHQFEAKLAGSGAIAKGDSVTSITATLTAEEMLVPKTGFLLLRNGAGEEQTFAYTARTKGTGTYTFTITATAATYAFAAGDTVGVPEALMVKAEGVYNEASNALNWVDDTRKDEGVFTVHFWMMSDKVMSFFDFETTEEMDVRFEHAIAISGEVVKRVQQEMYIKKPLLFKNPSASVPNVNAQGIANQAWVLSLLRDTTEVEYSVNGTSGWHAEATEDDEFYHERPKTLGGEWGAAKKRYRGAAGQIKSVTAVTGGAGTEASVENTGTSTEAELKFTIPQGAKGDTGAAAGFGTPTATATAGAAGGAPVVEVTASGENSAKVFNFAFTIPAGAQGTAAGFGTPTATVQTLDAGSNAEVAIAASGENNAKVFAFTFKIPRGETGFMDDATALDTTAAGYEKGSIVTFGTPVETYQVITATSKGETPANASAKFVKIAAAGGTGPKGNTGATGAAAGFGTPTATATALDYGKAPTVSITASGANTAKVFAFAFGIPKGKDGTNGTNGTNGTDGVTFTPSVSADGVLTWTNDGNKPNPAAVSIKGEAGSGVNPKGVYNAATTYAKFDMVRGNGGQWVSKVDNNKGNALPTLPTEQNDYWYLGSKDGTNGTNGTDGADGKNGTTYTPAVSASGDLSWTNDGGKPNPATVNLKGAQGESAYDVWKAQDGNSGKSEQAFLEDLRGKAFRHSFTSSDVTAGTLTIAKTGIPVSISDDSGVTYPIQFGTATIAEDGGSVAINMASNVAAIGKAITGTWQVNFAAGASAGSSGDTWQYGIDYDTSIATASTACKRIQAVNGAIYTDVSSFSQMPAHNFRRCVMSNLATRTIAYYLHPSNSNLKEDGSDATLTGADGDVMVEIPITHWRVDTYTDASAHLHYRYLVSDKPFPGSSIHPFFYVSPDGATARVQYVGAFRSVLCGSDGTPTATTGLTEAAAYASGNKFRSLPMYKPHSGATIAQYRAGHAANNGGTNVNCLFGMWAMLMMAIDAGSLDTQTLSRGFTNCTAFSYASLRETGRTLSFGNATGSVLADTSGVDADITTWLSGATSDKKVVQWSWRGIEDPFGALTYFEDGFQKHPSGYWFTQSTSKYSEFDSVLTAGEASGVFPPSGYTGNALNWVYQVFPNSGGFIKTFDKKTFLPLTIGGASTTYLCDRVYNDGETGARVIYRGGQQSAGGAAGMGCVYLLGERSVSLKYTGGRLAC